MSLSFPSATWSENTIPASFERSSDPSARSTPCPKVSAIRARPGVPGSTTARAALSPSSTTAPSAASRSATALFPDPIPPVSPTRSMTLPSLAGCTLHRPGPPFPDRLRGRLTRAGSAHRHYARGRIGCTLRFGAVADFDPSTPSIARVYDYLLNGKDNFAVDREVAQKLLAVVPISADVMRENRQFLARATRWAAGQGVTQFIDLGCGMPTEPNTHGSARTAVTEPRVAYVDNDAVVLTHLRARAAHGNSGVTVVEGDVREVAATVDAVSGGIDLSRPVCLLMGALLHFFPADAARDLVAAYVAALAPGSYVVLSVGRGDCGAANQ